MRRYLPSKKAKIFGTFCESDRVYQGLGRKNAKLSDGLAFGSIVRFGIVPAANPCVVNFKLKERVCIEVRNSHAGSNPISTLTGIWILRI